MTPVPALAGARQPHTDLSSRDARWLTAAVVAAHLLAVAALLQVDAVRRVVRDVAPLMVDLIAPSAAEPAPAAAPVPVPVPPTPPVPAFARTLPNPSPATRPLISAPPVPTSVPAADTPPAPTPLQPSASDTAVAAPSDPPPQAAALSAPALPAPPAPPRKTIPATALRYRVEPPFEVPRASRRAGEFGIVQLRIVVSVAGEPVQVSVLRSSGFARLDEQAVRAMRQARLQPYTEDGRPIEVEAIATADYPQE